MNDRGSMAAAFRDANRPPGIEVGLRRADTRNRPYAACDTSREEAPVRHGPKIGFFVISRPTRQASDEPPGGKLRITHGP